MRGGKITNDHVGSNIVVETQSGHLQILLLPVCKLAEERKS